jgi:YidC/Oxa1 family membrane protein insertase
MAQIISGESKKDDGSPRKKEMSMEIRLLLSFALMGAILFITPYYYKAIAPPAKPGAKAPAASERLKASGTQPAPIVNAGAKPAPPAEPRPVPGVAVGESESTFVVETTLYRIMFSNRGAVVRSWTLNKYRDHAGKPLELVNTAAKVDAPFLAYFRAQKPATDLSAALWVAKPDPDGLGISYQFSDGRVSASKSFRFTRDSYQSQVATEVRQDGKPLPHAVEWRGGFGDMAVPNPTANQHVLHWDSAAGKLVKTEAKSAKDGPVVSSGAYSFAGIEDTYFVAAFLPQDAATVDVVTFGDTVRTPVEQKEQPFPGVAVGSPEGANRFDLFVGPKDVDILRRVNPKLEQLVDFGWFAFIAKPLFLIVHWTAEHLVRNYGWAIIIVTIGINFLLFPLRAASMKSMKKMQSLQPQIAAINEKYRNIGMRDPKKADQNQEVMDLYKKHGVNPAGGCVPMLLQIPFFIAFYKVLSVSIELRNANWLWVTDLSQPEHLPIRILPVAMIITQFLMQKMTPSTVGDPNQQRIMMLMPLMLGFMFYGVSSGLVLYWLTGNLVSIAQQLFFNRTVTVKDIAQPVPAKKIKSSRR